MAALPYIQLYVADYLADTMHLTTEEHGAYLLLIFNYWQTGKPIPKNRLARIARLSNDRWISVEASLNEFFNDNGEEWEHQRIERDLEAVHATQSQRAAAGKASAEARKRKKETKQQRESNDRSTPVDGSLQQNPTNKDTDTDTDTDDTAALPHAHENPPTPPDDPRQRFAMFPTWDPDAKTFPAVLLQLGIPGIEIDQDQFLEFRSHWLTEPDTYRTQAKWEQSLANHLKRNLTQQAGRNTHGHNGSGQAQGGQRTGGQRKLSAVEQVQAAIAERQAREAAAGPAGQPLAEDDRDLRPPLDGEFWPCPES